MSIVLRQEPNALALILLRLMMRLRIVLVYFREMAHVDSDMACAFVIYQLRIISHSARFLPLELTLLGRSLLYRFVLQSDPLSFIDCSLLKPARQSSVMAYELTHRGNTGRKCRS